MAFGDILEPFERLLGEAFAPASIRVIEGGGDWRPSWDALEASGFLDALVPEAGGGFGLGWDAAGALFMALGRHAVPLPVGETMVMRAMLAEARESIPEGPLRPLDQAFSIALPDGEDLVGSPVKLESEEVCARLVLVYAAQIAGAAGRMLDMTVRHANERVQFGKPIGRQQAIQQQLAVMAEEVVATRLAVELACSAGSPDMLRAASAKSIASRFAASISATAHAVHGAIGISEEYDLQLYTRRMHAWRLACGAESRWDAEIGAAVLASGESALDWIRYSLHR